MVANHSTPIAQASPMFQFWNAWRKTSIDSVVVARTGPPWVIA
jgi:hypothetical protein